MRVVDVSGSEGRNPIDDFNIINDEISRYSDILKDKKQIVAANKTDIGGEHLEEFTKYVEGLGLEVFPISAAAHMGTGRACAPCHTDVLSGYSRFLFLRRKLRQSPSRSKLIRPLT